MKALIAGATGLVGQKLLNLLLHDSSYDKVTVVARRPSKIIHEKLEWIVLPDFHQLLSLSDKIQADHIYCCLGTTMAKAKSKKRFKEVDFEYPLKLAELGEKIGAKKFLLVSALGANSKSFLFYNRIKGQIENAISSYPYQTIGIFRPSVLKGKRNEVRMGEDLSHFVLPALNILTINLLRRYLPISASAVALAMQRFAESKKVGCHIIESNDIRDISKL